MVRDTTLDPMEVRQETAHGLSIGTITFDLESTLNPPSARSLKLHLKYFEKGDIYDDGVNGCQVGNHPMSINWHHDV